MRHWFNLCPCKRWLHCLCPEIGFSSSMVVVMMVVWAVAKATRAAKASARTISFAIVGDGVVVV
ncbi:hypothetical protein Hanom_Chr11g00989611 [Helianthus anomalus]